MFNFIYLLLIISRSLDIQIRTDYTIPDNEDVTSIVAVAIKSTTHTVNLDYLSNNDRNIITF